MSRLSLLLFFTALIGTVSVFGATWQQTNMQQSVIMGISMIDLENGYLAGGDNGVGSNILRTSDGGNSWNSTTISPAMMLAAVAASSPTSAVASGLMLLEGSIQYTVDGLTFHNASEPKVSMQQSQDAQIIGDNEGFAVVGGFSLYGEGNYSLQGVALSFGDGSSYTIANVVGDSESNYNVRYGAFPSTKVGYVTAGTWPPNAGTSINKDTWEVSKFIHARTDNSGMRVIPPNLGMPNHHGMRYDAGWIGKIFRSVGDGLTEYEEVFSTESFYFNQISCPTEAVCYAVGENDQQAYIYSTVDSGRTWNELLVLPGVSMMAAHALSENEAYFGGGISSPFAMNGTVVYTSNGGETFEVTTVEGFYFNDFSFVDSQNGWAAVMNTAQQCEILVYQ